MAAFLVAMMLAQQLLVPAPAASVAATFQLSGRVYQGQTGTEPPESLPLESIDLVLYGSNNKYYLGDALDEATTDSTGWYVLTVPDAPTKEFYTILLTVPSGYTEEGCTTVGGTTVSNTRIRYDYPLTGKTLTGNKFWLRGPATPTPTVTRTSVAPSATPTHTNTVVPTITRTGTTTVVPATATATHTGIATLTPTASPTGTRTALFPTATATRGRTPTPTPVPWVFRGTVVRSAESEEPSQPLDDVLVALFGSSSAQERGQQLTSARSSEAGQYELIYVGGAEALAQQEYEFLHLVVIDPRYRVVEAESASGGRVNDQHWISFAQPARAQYDGNDFVLQGVASIVRTFNGTVYAGNPGDRTQPQAGAHVSVSRAKQRCADGTSVLLAVTDSSGRFSIETVTEAEDDEPYWSLAIEDDDLVVKGALSRSGAAPYNGKLTFEAPPAGTFSGNEFWVGTLVNTKMYTFQSLSDATLDEAAPTTNYGTAATLELGYDTADKNHQRALLWFDLSSIPKTTTIVKASLHLYLQSGEGADPTCVQVYQCTGDWCEAAPCGGIAPVTWNRQPTCSSTANGERGVGTIAGYRQWEVTSLAQTWVTSPGTNLGLLVAGDEVQETWSRSFSSREGSQVPYLVVYVSANTQVATPTPTESPTPVSLDLSIQHVELTQGIQCMDNPECADNEVPLIVGKMTFARVFVKVTGATSVSGVSASAVATVGGKKYTAWSINSTIEALDSPSRGNFKDTLNFYLYGVNASGTLEVEVNPFGSIAESNYANNKKTVTLNFVSTPSLKIVPIWIYYTGGGQKEIVSWSMPGNLEGYTERIMPIPQVSWYLLTNPVLPWSEGIGSGASWGKLLAKVDELRKKSTTSPSTAHWYGMIPFDVPTTSISGLGYYNAYSCIGRTDKSHSNLEDSADIMVHELGHNLGRGHAPCGLEPTETPDAGYPYAGGGIGDNGWDSAMGGGGKKANYPDGYVVSSHTADMMSYCQDEWISEYTYQGILNYRGVTAAGASEAKVESTAGGDMRPYLFASGQIAEGGAELAPFSIMDRPEGFDDRVGRGEYALRLLSAVGAVLFERRFEGQQVVADVLPGGNAAEAAVSSQPFSAVLPWQPDTVRIELWRGEQMLAARPVSAARPMVVIVGPPAGSHWPAGGEYPLDWEAGDADGGPLWFDVAYSRDDGVSWEVFAAGLTEPHLLVSADQIAGSGAARFRVYATDGVLTGEATSGLITIDSKPPLVFVQAPERGQVIPPGVPVGLSGIAMDWEDNGGYSLELQWYSSQDGWLGGGSQLMVPGLSPGWHEILLAATDSDGMTGSAAVRVLVGFQLHLPVLMRRR